MITLLGCPVIRPSTVSECGRKKDNTQRETHNKPSLKCNRPNKNTHTHSLREKKTPKNEPEGEKNTPRIKQMCRSDGLCAKRANRKHTGKKTVKHKTTCRNQENNGRDKIGVRVSVYLLPDLCFLKPPNLSREDQANHFHGPELKGPERQTPFIRPKLSTETNHH